MDAYATIWLLVGTALGFVLGYTFHTFFVRRYLKKKLPEHPEYKMFLDILNGNFNIPKDENDTKD